MKTDIATKKTLLFRFVKEKKLKILQKEILKLEILSFKVKKKKLMIKPCYFLYLVNYKSDILAVVDKL